MNQAIIAELRFFGTSVVWGMLLLVIYDLLRIIRRVVKHNNFFVALQDILYWVTCSLLIFIMMYRQNNGIIRGFSILAMLLGMLIYHSLLSEYVVNAISTILNTIIRYIGKLIHLIITPFRFVFLKIVHLFRWLFSKFKKLNNNLVKLLKKVRKSSKIAVSENEKGD